MRCPRHPQRTATLRCSVCGRYHCADCARPDPGLAGPVCPDCAPAAARALASSGSARVAAARRRRILLFAGAGANAAAMAGAIVAVALLDGRPLAPGPADSQREARAYADLATTGAALESFRARTGRLPAELSELVPDFLPRLPADPFAADGRLLSWGPLPGDTGAHVLYSLGPDGLDQRGAPRDPLSPAGDLPYPVR